MMLMEERKTTASYVWQDRFGIPIDHPAAMDFFLKHLWIPHSRTELVRAGVLRNAPRRLRTSIVNAWSNSRNQEKDHEHVNLDYLRKTIEEALTSLRLPFHAPLSLLTVEDYNNSKRQQSVLFLFDAKGKLPIAVAKVTSRSEQIQKMEKEYGVLRSLARLRGDHLSRGIPKSIAFIPSHSFSLFIQSYCPGRSMYYTMRNAWNPAREARNHFSQARQWLLSFYQKFHPEPVRLDDPLIAEFIQRPLERYLKSFRTSENEKGLAKRALQKAHHLEGSQMSLVAGHGDYWARNLLLHSRQICVVDWENFEKRTIPFHDLFLFASSYALNYAWKPGRWLEPGAAFHSAFLELTWLAEVIREFLLDSCSELKTSPDLLEIFFAAFLAGKAVDFLSSNPLSQEEPRSNPWRILFQKYAAHKGPACFG